MKNYFIIMVIFVLITTQLSQAQVPQIINYQGVLSDGSERVNGEKTLTFRIYDVETGGTSLWDNYKTVYIDNGVFEAALGSEEALNLDFDKPYWLGIKVGSSEELSPRIPISSAPYSMIAGSVSDGAAVKSINQMKDNLTLKAGDNISITSANDSTIVISAVMPAAVSNTLDQAYDQGGAGQGRTIVADAGAVHISGNGGLTTDGSIGIGTTSPQQKLDVRGTLQTNGFKMPVNPTNGYILQCDANGVGTWKPAPSSGLGGGGTARYLPMFTSGTSVGNSQFYQNGYNIGLGTTAPHAKLDIESNASQDGIDINNTAGYGDPVIRFQLSGSTRYTVGIDDSDYDKFKIGVGSLDNNTRMTIDSYGRVGIGTTTPSAYTKLQVENSSYYAGIFSSNYANANTKVLYCNYTGSGNYHATAVYGNSQPADNYGYGGKFYGGNTGVYGSGDVNGLYGVAIDNSGYNTGVYGYARDGSTNYGMYAVGKNGSKNYGVYGYVYNSSSSAYGYGVLGYAGGYGYKYAVYASGNLVYTGSLYKVSDRKFKQNIKPLSGVLSKIMRLKVKTYKHTQNEQYKDFNLAEGKQYGLIAQELEEVFPEFVEEIAHPAAPDEEGNVSDEVIKYKAVNYTELIPVLIQAVQEQQQQIDALNEKVNALSAK